MISHICLFRMKGWSAGRHIDRPGAKYRYTLKSMYMIYDKAFMYYQDERLVGRSAGRHIDRPRAKYRSTSINIHNL